MSEEDTVKTKHRKVTNTNIKGYISGGILLLVVIITFMAKIISPYDPYEQNLAYILKAPFTTIEDNGRFFLLGTDQLGRDIFSRLLYGGRLSLLMGLASVAISGVIGTFLGVIAGYYRKTADAVIMRLSDMQLSIPTMLLAIMIVAVLGSSLINTILVLAVTSWVPFARVIRSEVISIREREFILAAKAMGVTGSKIIVTHILPNISYTLITQATLQIARMILLAASMSFLGLGVDVSLPTWGGMINDGRGYISDAWWLTVFPGLTIAFVIFCINIFSEWLQEKAD